MRTKNSCMFFMICALAITVLIFTGLSSARAATQAQIEQSIANGLAWLATQQEPGGGWGYDPGFSDPGVTGLVLLKFVDRAKELGLDPFDNDPASPTYYPYAGNVITGFEYIFSQMTSDASGIHIMNTTYYTSINAMAIAATNAPARTITTGPLSGSNYQTALQGMMDWMAYAQNDANCEIGGWGYVANQTNWSDQSNSGYATLGIGFASAAPPAGFGLLIPAGVQTKLDMYINNVQDPMDSDSQNYDGGSWYEPCTGFRWVNILKTGNLLYEMALVGDTTATTRVQNAISYIENHWNSTGPQPEFTPTSLGWMDSYQAMFTMMKGFGAFNISTIMVGGNPVNWFDEVSDVIVANQAPDGSFNHINPSLSEGEDSPNLRAAWALLTLERVVQPVVFGILDQCVPYGQQFTSFDADDYVTSGTPPYTWTWSGNVNLIVSKDPDNVFTITYPIDWTGSETITFTATDVNGQSSNDPATFTVDPVPVVGDIPNQTAPFSLFDLDNYLSGIGPSLVTWSYSGNSCLQVSIDGNNVVTVTNPGGCTDPETITFTATATACGNIVSDSDPATFTPNQPPVCTNAYADQGCLWSPNHTMVPVSILGVSDPDSDPVTIMITSITSDEATATVEGAGGETHAPDASGVGTSSAMIRAERSGGHDGRVYMINFTASDGK
ncbi:MAG: hypothetical protein ACM34I_10710, partial [bacterium]